MSAMPPPYDPAPPSPRQFPWVACAIIGALAFVFVVVGGIAVVGWLIFLRPSPEPPKLAPQQMQHTVPKAGPPAAPPRSPQGPPASAEEAVASVKARPEVSALLQMGPTPGITPRVELDSEDDDGYVVHVYQELTQVPQGAPASIDFGWYKVSKATGDVTMIPPPWPAGAAPRPRSAAPAMAPPQMPQQGRPKGSPGAAALTADGAIAKVKALPEVAEWAANVAAAGGSPHVDVDGEDPRAYTVHVYEVVKGDGNIPSHTATMGWFTVDKGTGEVRQRVP